MSTNKLSDEIDREEINPHRRRFFDATAITLAAAQLGMIGAAGAQSIQTNPKIVPTIKPGTNTSFAPLKQIDAGVLSVGYAEAGPANGPPVILLHGWPYEQGNGTVTEERLYQLIRQPNPIADRQFEIEFLDPGVEAFAFTFG